MHSFWLFYLPFIFKLFWVQTGEEIVAELKPENPKVEVGGSLVLNCTLKGYNETFNANSLQFYTIDDQFVHSQTRVLSESTAQFELVNISKSGVVSCIIPGLLKLGKDSRQLVSVARKPLHPKLISCHIIKMKEMSCSWSPSRKQQENYTLNPRDFKQHLQVALMRNNYTSTVCSKLKNSSCTFPLSNIGYDPDQSNEEVCVVIGVENILNKNVFSDRSCFNAYDVVYPETPDSIKVTHVNRSCFLEWSQPFQAQYIKLPLIYHITFETIFNQPVEMYEVVNRTNYLYTSCHPHVTYSCHIVSKPQLGGYKSGMLNFSFTTKSTVPCQSVEISPYEVFIDYEKHKILVYWEPISEKNYCGPGFEYALMKQLSLYSGDLHTLDDLKFSNTSVWNWSLMHNIIPTTSFITFVVPTSCISHGCDFSILAKNNIGIQNENISVFKWPRHESSPRNILLVKKLIVEKSVTNVYFSWEMSDGRNVSNVSNVTTVLYWCAILVHDVCSTHLKWRIIKSLEQDISCMSINNVTYGIAIFIDGYSSNIVWSNKVYNYSGVAQAPSHVTVKEAEKGFTVYWSFHQDECQHCSYVRHFIIYYCPTVDHVMCSGNVTEFKVSSGVRMFTVLFLEDETSYLFWMASSSRASLSAFTEAVLIKFSTIKRFFVLFIVLGLLLSIGIAYSTFRMYKTYVKCRKKFSSDHGIDVPQGICVLYRQTIGTRSSSSEDVGSSSGPSSSNGTGTRKHKREQDVKNEPTYSSYQNNQSTTRTELSSSSSMSPNYFEFSRLLSSLPENCDNDAEYRRIKSCEMFSTKEVDENFNLRTSQLLTVSSDNNDTIYSIVRPPDFIKQDAIHSIFLNAVLGSNSCDDFTYLYDHSNVNQPLTDHYFSNVDSFTPAKIAGQFNFDPISDYCQLPGFGHFNSSSHDTGDFKHSAEKPISSTFCLDTQTLANIEQYNSCLDPISDYCQLPGMDHLDSGKILSTKPILCSEKKEDIEPLTMRLANADY